MTRHAELRPFHLRAGLPIQFGQPPVCGAQGNARRRASIPAWL